MDNEVESISTEISSKMTMKDVLALPTESADGQVIHVENYRRSEKRSRPRRTPYHFCGRYACQYNLNYSINASEEIKDEVPTTANTPTIHPNETTNEFRVPDDLGEGDDGNQCHATNDTSCDKARVSEIGLHCTASQEDKEGEFNSDKQNCAQEHPRFSRNSAPTNQRDQSEKSKMDLTAKSFTQATTTTPSSFSIGGTRTPEKVESLDEQMKRWQGAFKDQFITGADSAAENKAAEVDLSSSTETHVPANDISDKILDHSANKDALNSMSSKNEKLLKEITEIDQTKITICYNNPVDSSSCALKTTEMTISNNDINFCLLESVPLKDELTVGDKVQPMCSSTSNNPELLATNLSPDVQESKISVSSVALESVEDSSMTSPGSDESTATFCASKVNEDTESSSISLSLSSLTSSSLGAQSYDELLAELGLGNSTSCVASESGDAGAAPALTDEAQSSDLTYLRLMAAQSEFNKGSLSTIVSLEDNFTKHSCSSSSLFSKSSFNISNNRQTTMQNFDEIAKASVIQHDFTSCAGYCTDKDEKVHEMSVVNDQITKEALSIEAEHVAHCPGEITANVVITPTTSSDTNQTAPHDHHQAMKIEKQDPQQIAGIGRLSSKIAVMVPRLRNSIYNAPQKVIHLCSGDSAKKVNRPFGVAAKPNSSAEKMHPRFRPALRCSFKRTTPLNSYSANRAFSLRYASTNNLLTLCEAKNLENGGDGDYKKSLNRSSYQLNRNRSSSLAAFRTASESRLSLSAIVNNKDRNFQMVVKRNVNNLAPPTAQVDDSLRSATTISTNNAKTKMVVKMNTASKLRAEAIRKKYYLG